MIKPALITTIIGENTMTDKDLNDTPQRIPKIRSLTDITRAMNRIHREARLGTLSTADMGRYGAFYNLFAGMLRDGVLEERLQQLEDMQGIPRKGVDNVSKQH